MNRIILLLIIGLFFSCQKNEEPSCFSDKISIFQNEQSDCPNAFIAKYRFQDMILYGFADGQCIADGGMTLWNELCEIECFVGGIAALTDCNGVNFNQNAELLEYIWRAP